MTRRHIGAHRYGPWFRAARGRAEQGPGRHSVAYLAQRRAGGDTLLQPNVDGLYPMGAAQREPHVPWDDAQLYLLDRLNNDPHIRVTLAEVMPSAAR